MAMMNRRVGGSHWINVLLRMSLRLMTTGDTREQKQAQRAVRCRNGKPN